LEYFSDFELNGTFTFVVERVVGTTVSGDNLSVFEQEMTMQNKHKMKIMLRFFLFLINFI
jgi:hypothetical protein